MWIASIIWIAGIAALLAHALISYLRLRKTISAAVVVRGRLMACDEVRAPFPLFSGIQAKNLCTFVYGKGDARIRHRPRAGSFTAP